MGKKQLAKTPVRTVKSVESLIAAHKDLNEALNRGAPLACVLIGVAATENALMSLLASHFLNGETSKNILEGRGWLTEYRRCADMAYCLGLIPKQLYKNLCTAGDIRNQFAHSHVSLTFEHPNIAPLCEELVPPSALGISDELAEILKNPRARFTTTVGWMFGRLLMLAGRAKHREENTDSW
jgi:hypothetical protein